MLRAFGSSDPQWKTGLYWKRYGNNSDSVTPILRHREAAYKRQWELQLHYSDTYFPLYNAEALAPFPNIQTIIIQDSWDNADGFSLAVKESDPPHRHTYRFGTLARSWDPLGYWLTRIYPAVLQEPAGMMLGTTLERANIYPHSIRRDGCTTLCRRIAGAKETEY